MGIHPEKLSWQINENYSITDRQCHVRQYWPGSNLSFLTSLLWRNGLKHSIAPAPLQFAICNLHVIITAARLLLTQSASALNLLTCALFNLWAMQILHHFLAMVQQTVNTTSNPIFSNISKHTFKMGLNSYGSIWMSINSVSFWLIDWLRTNPIWAIVIFRI